MSALIRRPPASRITDSPVTLNGSPALILMSMNFPPELKLSFTSPSVVFNSTLKSPKSERPSTPRETDPETLPAIPLSFITKAPLPLDNVSKPSPRLIPTSSRLIRTLESSPSLSVIRSKFTFPLSVCPAIFNSAD